MTTCAITGTWFQTTLNSYLCVIFCLVDKQNNLPDCWGVVTAEWITAENKTTLSFQTLTSFHLLLGRKIHQCQIMWQGRDVTKALCPQVTQCWLTLACAVQLPPPAFGIIKSVKGKEETDFAVLHNRVIKLKILKKSFILHKYKINIHFLKVKIKHSFKT